MNIVEFKSELITNINNFFPKADITIVEKRGIMLEVRVNISEYVFVEIYYNALTGKKSYALINKGVRIFGCDNYKFWHLHPVDNPSEHIPCDEPTMQDVFSKVEDILSGK